MGITHEDLQEIKRVLDERYVQIVDCDTTQKAIDKKFANDDKRIDILLLEQKKGNNDIKKNNWLTTTILAILIAGVVGYIFMNFGG